MKSMIEQHEAYTVLRGFWRAMNDWERTNWSLYEAGEIDDAQLYKKAANELEEIFRQFCAVPPKRGVNFQSPPEYDPESEQVVQVSTSSPSRVIVETKQITGFRKMCRYTVQKTDKVWKIAKKEVSGEEGFYPVHL